MFCRWVKVLEQLHWKYGEFRWICARSQFPWGFDSNAVKIHFIAIRTKTTTTTTDQRKQHGIVYTISLSQLNQYYWHRPFCVHTHLILNRSVVVIKSNVENSVFIYWLSMFIFELIAERSSLCVCVCMRVYVKALENLKQHGDRRPNRRGILYSTPISITSHAQKL